MLTLQILQIINHYMITLSVLLSDLEDPHFRTEHFYLQMPLVSHTAPWPRTMSGLVRAILIVRLLRCTGSNRSMIKALRTIWNAAVILQFVWKMCVCVSVCVFTRRTTLALVPVGKKRHAKKEGHRKRERKREGGSEGAREGTKNTRGPCLPCGTITFLHNLPIAKKNATSLWYRDRVAQRPLHTT